MPYAYTNSGLTCWIVEDGYVANENEFVSEQPATEQQLSEAFPSYASEKAKSDTLEQICALENTVTERRLREAILQTDNGWLENLNDQIAALRAQT